LSSIDPIGVAVLVGLILLYIIIVYVIPWFVDILFAIADFIGLVIGFIILIIPYVLLIILLLVVIYVAIESNRKRIEKKEVESRKVMSALRKEKKRQQALEEQKRLKEEAERIAKDMKEEAEREAREKEAKKAEKLRHELWEDFAIDTATSQMNNDQLEALLKRLKSKRKKEKAEVAKLKKILDETEKKEKLRLKKEKIKEATRQWYEELDEDEQLLLTRARKAEDNGYYDIADEAKNELSALRLHKQKVRLEDARSYVSSYGKLGEDMDYETGLDEADKEYEHIIRLARDADCPKQVEFFEDEWRQIREIRSKQRVNRSRTMSKRKNNYSIRRQFHNAFEEVGEPLDPFEKGKLLEIYVQEIFTHLNYDVKNPHSDIPGQFRDKMGVDLEIRTTGPIKAVYAAQCKFYAQPMQTNDLRGYLSIINSKNVRGESYSKLFVICPGDFTDDARKIVNLHKDGDKIELWDYDKLEEMAVSANIPL